MLESAHLESYYDNFVEVGADSLKQLLDASDEELREITDLVGMSSKKLHVKRLQKALQAWGTRSKLKKNLICISFIPESKSCLQCQRFHRELGQQFPVAVLEMDPRGPKNCRSKILPFFYSFGHTEAKKNT